MTETADSDQTFDCPRCGAPVTERFWGPCSGCRAQLVAALGTGPAESESVGTTGSSRFEPSMHVVPNHVATKD